MRVLSFDLGTKNLAACSLELSADGKFKIADWWVKSVIEKGGMPEGVTSVNKVSLDLIAPMFSRFVKANIGAWAAGETYDRIFIESQPMGGRGSARNIKTKVLSHILQCELMAAFPGVPVGFVHAGLKLKDMPRIDGKSSYRENKKYAVTKTAEYLASADCQSAEYVPKYEKAAKKDDLADSFLQGLIAGLIYARGQIVEPPAVPVKPKRAAPKRSINVIKKAAAEAAAAEPKATGSDAAAAEPKADAAAANATPKKAKPVKADKAEKKAEASPAAAPAAAEPAAEQSEPSAGAKRKRAAKADKEAPVIVA